MADEEKKDLKPYHDHGWPWYHWHFWPFSGFNNMFTQPLLFDDSLTLLQKIAMLWKKLYDLIQDYEQFKKDFATWKAQVESALADLAAEIEALDARVTALEECCEDMRAWKDLIDAWKATIDAWKTSVDADIAEIKEALDALGDPTQLVQQITNNTTNITNLGTDVTELQRVVNNHTTNLSQLDQSVTNLGNSITTLETDLTALTNRVSANEDDITDIKNALARLDIQLPEQLIDDTNFGSFADAWYAWISNYCDTAAGHTSGTFAAALARTLKTVPGDIEPVPGGAGYPATSLTIGKLGQNIVLCKLPLLLKATLTQATTEANVANVMTEIKQLVTDSGLDQLFRKGITSRNPYFTGTGLTAYPYLIDNCKFLTSYMVFMSGGAPAGDLNKLYKMDFAPDGTMEISTAESVNMNVRIALTQNSNDIKMQVISNELYFAVGRGEVLFYFIAENS